jgi:FixJ family two-component response regulator
VPVNKRTSQLISLISIVDDDQSVREATTSLLKSNGFRTEVFSSAEEFLRSPLIRETKCLLLDLQMSGMSGLELQRRLVTEAIQIPIIFITAHADKKIRSEVLRAGAIELLSKPFSEDALLRAIRFALGSVSRE